MSYLTMLFVKIIEMKVEVAKQVLHIHALRDFSWHCIILLVFISHQNNSKVKHGYIFREKWILFSLRMGILIRVNNTKRNWRVVGLSCIFNCVTFINIILPIIWRIAEWQKKFITSLVQTFDTWSYLHL